MNRQSGASLAYGLVELSVSQEVVAGSPLSPAHGLRTVGGGEKGSRVVKGDD